MLSSECLSQQIPRVSLLKYFLNLFPFFYHYYRYLIQILIFSQLSYWSGLLNNFSATSLVLFRSILHSWLLFPSIKPFSNSAPFPQENGMFLRLFMTCPRTASSPSSFALSLSLPWGLIHTKHHRLVFFLLTLLLFMLCHAFFFFFTNCSLLNNRLPPFPPTEQPN